MSRPEEAATRPHRLRQAERIRRRPEFERAYNDGVRIHGRLMTLFVIPNGGNAPRFGVAATRKLGSAVERNRAKRLAREVFRRHKVAGSFDIVVVPRREMLNEPFANLESDYCSALERRDSRPPRRRPHPNDRRHRPRAAAGI